jgi:hypothetical protein
MNKLQKALEPLSSAAVMMPRSTEVMATIKAVKSAIRLEMESSKPDHELQRDRLERARTDLSDEGFKVLEKYLAASARTKEPDEQILCCLFAAQTLEKELGEDCTLREGLCVWLPLHLRKRFLKGLNEPIPEPKQPEPMAPPSAAAAAPLPAAALRRPANAKRGSLSGTTNSYADASGFDGSEETGGMLRRRDLDPTSTATLTAQGGAGRRVQTPSGEIFATAPAVQRIGAELFDSTDRGSHGTQLAARTGAVLGAPIGMGAAAAGRAGGGRAGVGSGVLGHNAHASGDNGRSGAFSPSPHIDEREVHDELKSVLAKTLKMAGILNVNSDAWANMSPTEMATLVAAAASKMDPSTLDPSVAHAIQLATRIAQGDTHAIESLLVSHSPAFAARIGTQAQAQRGRSGGGGGGGGGMAGGVVAGLGGASARMSLVDMTPGKVREVAKQAVADKSMTDPDFAHDVKMCLAKALVAAGIISSENDPRLATISAQQAAALLASTDAASLGITDPLVLRAFELSAQISNGEVGSARELVSMAIVLDSSMASQLSVVSSMLGSGGRDGVTVCGSHGDLRQNAPYGVYNTHGGFTFNAQLGGISSGAGQSQGLSAARLRARGESGGVEYGTDTQVGGVPTRRTVRGGMCGDNIDDLINEAISNMPAAGAERVPSFPSMADGTRKVEIRDEGQHLGKWEGVLPRMIVLEVQHYLSGPRSELLLGLILKFTRRELELREYVTKALNVLRDCETFELVPLLKPQSWSTDLKSMCIFNDVVEGFRLQILPKQMPLILHPHALLKVILSAELVPKVS